MIEELRDEILEGERVARFLADDAVKGAIQRLSDRYVAQWKASEVPAEREVLWAKARVIEELQIELQAIVGNGTRARVLSDRAERARNRKG